MYNVDKKWFIIYDGVKSSPLHFGIMQILDYIESHDLSPDATVYIGHIKGREFISDDAFFVEDFLSEVHNH